MKNGVKPISAATGLLMFFGLWQIMAWVVARPIMPSPVVVLPIFARNFFGELGLHFLASTGRVLASIALAVDHRRSHGPGTGADARH